MKAYKWELRKGSKKEICPACGRKRFVPYVATADGRTLAGVKKYGRCDREQSCGYNLYPNGISAAKIKPIIREPEPPLKWYPSAIQINYNTPLFIFASQRLGVELATKVWNEYKIGADGKRTVFWQIAKDGEVRAGKSIPYKTDGHRDKNDKKPVNWCNYSKRFDGLHTGKEIHQCFFGEHLLQKYPDKVVAIVESEKTAALMSARWTNFVWLASGGSQGLNDDKLKVLKGRKVVLFPDNGQFANWSKIAQDNFFKIDRYTDLHPVFEGCDILDYEIF